MSISIVDVAKMAKVSRMTVTRVMRNDSVLPKTRKRVIKAISKLGYIPSPAARAMRSSDPLRATQANCFALIFAVDTQLANEFFSEVTRGVEKEAANFGLCPLQVQWLENSENSWLKMQTVLGIEGLCGVILVGQFTPTEIKSILKINKNTVLVDAPVPPEVKMAGVEADNVGGAEMAFQHLLGLGCKNPLILLGPEKHYFAKAINKAVSTFKNKFKSIKTIHTDYTFESGKEKTIGAIKAKEKFDSVFANDTLAAGALKGLLVCGIPVPEKIKIVGFDNIPLGEYLSPSLTSISIDKKMLGREAVKILVEQIRNKEVEHKIKVTIKAELIKRESSFLNKV